MPQECLQPKSAPTAPAAIAGLATGALTGMGSWLYLSHRAQLGKILKTTMREALVAVEIALPPNKLNKPYTNATTQRMISVFHHVIAIQEICS